MVYSSVVLSDWLFSPPGTCKRHSGLYKQPRPSWAMWIYLSPPSTPNQFLTINTQPLNATSHHPQYHQHTDIPESSNTRNAPSSKPNIPRSFLYSDTIINEGINACKRSIIGKIITDKPIHVSSIQNGLENIWGAPPGLKIQVLEGKLLQFFMNDIADQHRILQGNPWIFRNSWLVVKPWDREIDYHTMDFDHVPIWIQLWGLPPHCKTKQMGESISTLLGNVEAAKFYEYPKKEVIIKVKVGINIKNPILSGIHVGNPTDGTSLVDYRYEKLPQVCFKCGMIGHADKLCRNQALYLETLAPLGPWIRSTKYGKRKMEEKDRKFYSNPSHGKNFGHYSPPVPADLLEKLAAMKVKPTPTTHSPQNPPQYTQNHNNLIYTESPTMECIQTQQDERIKKAHRINFHNEPQTLTTITEAPTQEQQMQVKRQKMEDNLRVGTAKQASPSQ
ncbi:zinc CCHC-type-like protein [Trifolium medium]|uniref:Zinc CCHC-type-like protein n=1 Tax=Trifolium medium TaxID=97028 RepID=A0A392MC18_9FABA|nr:zinc CCHC-type-like protein [Trifolium medium]